MDQRYLNYSYTPIVSPMQKPLQTDMYNDTQLGSHHDSISSEFQDRVINPVKQDVIIPSPDKSKESATSTTLLSPYIDQLNYSKRQDLDGTLFFITYTVANVLRPPKHPSGLRKSNELVDSGRSTATASVRRRLCHRWSSSSPRRRGL